MYLFDINLLTALFTQDHELHHFTAKWWGENTTRKWATCETTQSAYIRLSANPHVGGVSIPFSQSLEVLRKNTAQQDHTFLSQLSQETWETVLVRCQGYRQVTDAYLIALALSHGCKFATFDQKLRHLSPDPEAVEVIPLI